MSEAEPGIVCVGGGHAAGQLLVSLRKGGYEGPLTLVAEEAFHPYQRPPLSKDYLAGKVELQRLLFRPASFYEQHAIDLRLGVAATAIDRAAGQVALADGSRLDYTGLALTTGARVRELSVPGVELPGVHYLRSIADVDAIRAELGAAARIVVIGGGFIGLEVAAVARGARWVAVCGSLPPGLPADTPARIVAWGRRRGVRIAVDTRGPALAQAWARGPDLLHVNADEAAAHLGTPPGAIPAAPAGDAARAARGAITSGAGTFPAWEGTRTWRATPPAVRVRNAVGCGDALLAGLLAQLLAGDAFASALRFATALGSADATSPVAGRPDLALARELVARVAIEEERRG